MVHPDASSNDSFQAVVEFCRDNQRKHAHQTIEIGERALRNHGDPSDPLHARLQLHVGNAYVACGRVSRAIPLYRDVLAKESTLDKEIIADANICLSSLFLNQGDFHTTSTFLEAALERLPEHGALRKIPHLLYNLAWCQSELRLFEQARNNYIRASDLCDEIGDMTGLHCQILVSLGILCMDMEHWGEADLHLNRALRMSERHEDPQGIANAKAELGRLWQQYRMPEEALQLFDEGIDGFLKLGEQGYAAEVMLYKGQLLSVTTVELASTDSSLILFREALAIAESQQNLMLQQKAHQALSGEYERQGDPAGALHHFKRYHELSQAIESDVSRRRVEHLHLLTDLHCDRVRHDVVLEKNEELAVANQRLARLLDERRELMGLAAHDLKNPLASILTMVEMLQVHECCKQFADIPSLLEILEISATSAREIIHNILEDDRLEQGNIELKEEPTELVKLCREVIRLHEHRAVAKGIRLQFEPTFSKLVCHVDPFTFRQALENLISNAVKFCSTGNRVDLTLNVGAFIEVAVVDDGPGISESDQGKLFQRFAKLSNKPTGNEGSSGLGLAIVKKLVELNGGTIHCESELGRGTTFRICLPTSA